MASSLPTEVLIAICEQVGSTTANELPRDAREKHAAVGSQLGVFKPCVLDLRAFSGASRRFREVATPLLFRNVCVRTREQVVGLVGSKLLVHVCHVHFPAINILTCRRPLGSHIATLIQQAQSLRVASSEPAFYTDLNRHLGSLLRSTQHLLGLEVYGEAHVPHVDAMAVLADFISVIPKTVQTLTMSLPGGRPSFAGIETFFARISPDDVIDPPLPSLKHLYVSLQLPLQIALAPSELALPLARRLPKLDLIAIAAPKRGAQPGMPPWDLGGPGGHAAGWGMSGGHVKIWKVRRRLDGSAGLGDTGNWEQASSLLQVGDFVDTYL